VSDSDASGRPMIPPEATLARRTTGSLTPSNSRQRPPRAHWLLAIAGLIRRIPNAPSWLLSVTVHLALLLLLALLPLDQLGPRSLTLLLGATEGNDSVNLLEEASLTLDAADQFEVLPDSADQTLLEWVEFDREEVFEELKVDFELPKTAPEWTISSHLGGRQSEAKEFLLRQGGGTKETEDAVQLGLQWLAKNQRGDGGWALKGQFADPANTENRTAATAMALNAFLGAGYTHLDGDYKDLISRGLHFLLKRQSENGFFCAAEPPAQQAYGQAIATLTILESYGMTNEYDLLEPAKRAVQYAEWSQSDLGGWRYQPRQDADTSVTGWFVMALETAKRIGLEVDESRLESVDRYLDSVSHRSDSAYSYNAMTPPDLTMTAEGILCRMLLGWPRTHPALARAVEELVANIPHQQDPLQSVYYWYYATQVLHHYGGNAWQKWNEGMKKALPASQEKQGKEKGSWSPARDAYGAAGGRLYTTCLSIYCLEVYYRHLAIYSIE
jgi:hypothetical protein